MGPPPSPPVCDAGLLVAVVLAGGAGRRLGGVDKAGLVVGGRPLLDRVLAAAAGVAGRLVVVGPPRPVGMERAVIFLQEREPGGGPVPAVAAALDATGGASVVFLLAVDLPLLSSAHLGQLVNALRTADPPVGAVAAADPRGQPNPLLAAYRADALRVTMADIVATAPAGGAGVAAARLLPSDVLVIDLGPEATLNVNRPDDLERAVAAVEGVRDPPDGAC